MCTLSQTHKFLLITRACVLNYKHTNTTSNKNHPYFLDTNKQIQGLINLKRNVFLITNTQIQGLINHKHNNTNTRSKWQAGQVEQVVLGGAGSGRDQVKKNIWDIFYKSQVASEDSTSQKATQGHRRPP